MMRSFCPQPPEWTVDWSGIDAEFPWIRALEDCPQDPLHHGEGNVWIHTRMVCEQLAALEAWRALPEGDREILFWVALLHDVAKPVCTRHESDGRITARGHALRGANMARQILWQGGPSVGLPFKDREAIVHLVRHHMLPYWLIERADHERTLTLASQHARCDWLEIFSQADARGRICQDVDSLLENIGLFGELAREFGCVSGPRAFVSEHARFLYGQDRWPHCDVAPHEDFGSEVVLMSGFPGVGKDTWIKQHLPGWKVISLDEIRRRLGFKPTDRQGRVIQEARSQAREYLREGAPFVWNATNLSRQLREACVGLFASYKAHIRIVYLEVSQQRLRKQNRERAEAVPEAVLDKLARRWEIPEVWEGHRVEVWVDAKNISGDPA